jgi:hypothetical protein
MTLAEEFALTAEEQLRLDEAPFRGTDASGWRRFAGYIQEQLLAAYAAGEVDLRQALNVMRSCSLGCSLNDRIIMMAHMVERALHISPKTLNRKRPPHPTWLRHSAAALVSMLHEEHPDQPVAPNEANDWTTPILEIAIAWLVTLRLCDSRQPIRPRTLYDWCLEHKRTPDTA